MPPQATTPPATAASPPTAALTTEPTHPDVQVKKAQYQKVTKEKSNLLPLTELEGNNKVIAKKSENIDPLNGIHVAVRIDCGVSVPLH